MPTPIVLVTGANGQLGSAIRLLAKDYPAFTFLFVTKEDLPVHDAAAVQTFFKKNAPAYCINCAAYTAVDKAETEKEMAMLVNARATGLLAAASASTGTKFIHISTDYVFDGAGSRPYKEDDPTSPVNFYGESKLAGEVECLKQNSESVIIRTSWVYSEFGNNFVKTMRRLMSERDNLNVVSDQYGSPTYAVDLAAVLLSIIADDSTGKSAWSPGIYHYSNEGIISWYDFATAIKNLLGSSCLVHPIPTTSFPTPARRPAYSVMDKSKIKSVYGISIPNWEDRLALCLSRL